MKEEKKQDDGLTMEEAKSAIREVIRKIRRIRRETVMTSDGCTLKRDPFTNLDEKGILTPDNIVKEFNNIQAKASKLSSSERKFVQQIFWVALRKAADLKTMQLEAQKQEGGQADNGREVS